jgi:DNA-binding response OmpR family regulator
MRLLLVDDDEVLLDALSNHLIAQKYWEKLVRMSLHLWIEIAKNNFIDRV